MAEVSGGRISQRTRFEFVQCVRAKVSVCQRRSGQTVWISGTRESWGLKVNRQGKGEQISRYISGLGVRGPAEVQATESEFLVGGDENK